MVMSPLKENKVKYFSVIAGNLASRGLKRLRGTEQFPWVCYGKNILSRRRIKSRVPVVCVRKSKEPCVAGMKRSREMGWKRTWSQIPSGSQDLCKYFGFYPEWNGGPLRRDMIWPNLPNHPCVSRIDSTGQGWKQRPAKQLCSNLKASAGGFNMNRKVEGWQRKEFLIYSGGRGKGFVGGYLWAVRERDLFYTWFSHQTPHPARAWPRFTDTSPILSLHSSEVSPFNQPIRFRVWLLFTQERAKDKLGKRPWRDASFDLSIAIYWR